MLFNSYEFLLFFLPLTVGVHRLLVSRAASLTTILIWLCIASFFFYAWWEPSYLILLAASLSANYLLVLALSRVKTKPIRQFILCVGILGNLGVLCYYKYTKFILENLIYIGVWHGNIPNIILPLAVSFFTFQQIAYMVTCYHRPSARCSPLEHTYFIVFFPHLLSGPIVYQNELIDQVRQGKLFTATTTHLAKGLILFLLGLSKKLLLGENLASLVDPLYNSGGAHGSIDAWLGSIFYGLESYFDFSAYSDMALGLAYMFGINFPINFDSPLKTSNYRAFWQRWHITLFRFLRDHIYVPLYSRQRKRLGKKPGIIFVSLLTGLVFFISGLWHGAAWTFILWGIITWLLILLNDFWIFLWEKTGWNIGNGAEKYIGRIYVFLAACLTCPLVRSPTFNTAMSFFENLWSPLDVANSQIIKALGRNWIIQFFSLSSDALAACLLVITFFLIIFVWYLPNAVRYVLHEEELYRNLESKFSFGKREAILLGILAWLSLLSLPRATTFIYYHF